MLKSKQFLITLVLVGSLLPNMALASWYNPFSWGIFSWFKEIIQTDISPSPELSVYPPISDEGKTETKNDQSVEIEKLKQEVEKLKEKTATVAPAPKQQVVPTSKPKPIPLPPTANNNSQIPTSPQNVVSDIVPRVPQNLVPQIQIEDSNLKIARCQAEAKTQAGTMKQFLYKSAEDGFGKNIADAEEGIRKSKLEQLARMAAPMDEELRTLSPEQQSSIRASSADALQPTIDYYVSMKQKNLRLLEESKKTIDRNTDQSYNESYLKCINK